MELTKNYRQILVENGTAPVSLYNGDPGFRNTMQNLIDKSGEGVVDESNPNLPIPGKIIQHPSATVPVNTAAIAPGEPGPGTGTGSQLSLQGAVQWVKDNPGKTLVIAGVGYLILREILKKK